jgi:hypothetical protein
MGELTLRRLPLVIPTDFRAQTPATCAVRSTKTRRNAYEPTRIPHSIFPAWTCMRLASLEMIFNSASLTTLYGAASLTYLRNVSRAQHASSNAGEAGEVDIVKFLLYSLATGRYRGNSSCGDLFLVFHLHSVAVMFCNDY